MTLTLHHRVPREDLGLGLVRVEGVRVAPAAASLGDELERWITRRREEPLSPGEEALRKGGRDILRNGRYKPTGRGKPASEYLMRAASEGSFPRINGPVDANNLVSLKHCVAVSVWDLDLCGATELEFRLGRTGEDYVFNAAGQTLQLEDLVCGCGLPGSLPVVTPIKDSLKTKIVEGSTRLAGCIYYPLPAGDAGHLDRITTELLGWLRTCGDGVDGAADVCLPGGTARL